MKKFKSAIAVALAGITALTMVVGMAGPGTVDAGETDPSTTAATTAATVTGPIAGSPSDVTISDVHVPEVKAGEKAIIGFDLNLNRFDSCLLSKIYVKDSTSSAYIADQGLDAYIPLYGGYRRCDFFLNTKKDTTTGYHPVTFVVEYVQTDSSGSIIGTYYVEKSIDIYIIGKDGEKDETTKSVPRIMVTGFETNPAKVMAGQEFDLTVHLQNTSNTTVVSNVKITLSTANNEFLPTSGSSTEFVRSIGCGATKDIVIKMQAQANLDQKPYVLTVACEYEGEKNTPYTASESISVPVYQESKAKITDVSVSPEAMEVGGQGNVMFSINNTGRTTLYNVQVAIDSACQSVQADDSFVGNIASGATGYADFMINGIAPTTDDGRVKVIISYEDASGNQGTFETEINVFVFEPVFEEPGFSEEFPMEDFEEPKKTPVVPIIGGIVALAAVITTIIVIVIKKKKRKALEEELEDEIS